MDEHGPELADAERLDALIGTDETAERLHLEPTVGVGHIGPREAIDAGAPCEVARRDLRQPAVVTPREVVSDLPQLLVDDVEVVEEPVLGERDLTLRPDRRDDAVICAENYAPVVVDPRKKITSSDRRLRDAIGRRQAPGVLLQALGAKDLGADRCLHARRSSDRSLCEAHDDWRSRRRQDSVVARVMKGRRTAGTPAALVSLFLTRKCAVLAAAQTWNGR